MSTGADDRELEQLLSETSGLRQRYRSSLEEPPAALDDAIRAAARREVSARPRLAGSPFSGSWRIPLSIAAVVVVSATLTVMFVERDAHLPRVGATVSTPRAEPERKDTAPAIAPPAGKVAPPVSNLEPRASKPDAAERFKSKESTPSSNSVTRDELDRRAPPRELEEKASKSESVNEQEKKTAPAPSPEPFPAQAPAASPAPAKPSTQNAARGFTQPPSSSEVPSPPSAGPARESQAPARLQPGASSAKDQGGLRDAPVAAGAVAPKEQRERVAPSSAAPAAPAAEAAGTLAKKQLGGADAYSDSAGRPWEQDPATWLKHIETLRAAGHIDEAKTSFESFRRHYPDYQLPTGFVVPGS